MFRKIREDWELLNRPIYTGERLQGNLHALTIVSIFTALLGLVLMIVDLVTGDKVMFATAFLTFLGGVGCGYFAGVQKNRERAALIPTLFCIFAFTFYTINGLGEGSAMLWSLMAPIGLCYFVSVRNGIFVSLYYTVFFFVIFYTPLREHMRPYYTDAFLTRFPILYASMTAFVIISMTQYHRGILLENEYAEKLNEEVARQTEVAEARAKKIEQMSFQTIQTLASAIDAKDPYTKGHSARVSQYSVLIAKALNWDAERINNLRYAAMLHDIGKIGVPDSILNNPKRLTDMEYNIIKSHTVMGGDILKDRSMIQSAEDVARSHHERYDGKGYPRGLKGEEISEEARIAAIADAFDAMSSNRVYRSACDYGHIRDELVNGKGRQFDPRFTDIFIGLWDRGMLDDILQQSASDDEGSIEASGLLREAMDTILSQNVEETDILTSLMNRGAGEAAIDQVDMEKLINGVSDSGSYEGAMDVEYRQFSRLYEYVNHLSQRFCHPFKLVMITLKANAGEQPGPDALDSAMYYMEQSIRQTIRNVDVLTRFNQQCFLVILIGADSEGVKIAMDRIFRGYYKMIGSSAFSPSYSVYHGDDSVPAHPPALPAG